MKFICDVMLGKLAKYLRLLGHDAVYARSQTDLDHYRRHDEERIVLTRRRKARSHERTVYVESEIPREQLRQITAVFGSTLASGRNLHRCIECNVELKDVEKEEIEAMVPEFVYHTYSAFKMCPSCKRVYWEGSHISHIAEMIKDIMD
jgi:uncharacterized protein